MLSQDAKCGRKLYGDNGIVETDFDAKVPTNQQKNVVKQLIKLNSDTRRQSDETSDLDYGIF